MVLLQVKEYLHMIAGRIFQLYGNESHGRH